MPPYIVWNTQRPYGPFGQRMAAFVLDHGAEGTLLAFLDADRSISGVVRCAGDVLVRLGVAQHVSEVVMREYDAGRYSDDGLYGAAQQIGMDAQALRAAMRGAACAGHTVEQDEAAAPSP